MSLAIVYSRASHGIRAPLVTVEAHLSGGLPGLSIVGLAETAVKESKHRVRSALLNSHFEFPPSKVTINLAPADLPKEGGRFDLAIALGILVASGQLPKRYLEEYEFIGELALSGELRPVPAILPIAFGTQQAGRKLILPLANGKEAALVKNLEVYGAMHLLEVCAHLKNELSLSKVEAPLLNEPKGATLDLADVKGQAYSRRALEVAAAGGHSLLMIGPPGTGKTMLASRLPGILPSMNDQEALETATIASISHKGFDHNDWSLRPFRAPHHSASSVALVGGGNPPRPGEISLAHGGVLFLDELPEFNRHVLEALREPLESGCITISRAARQCEFPANFQLIAAMNPCPCGYAGDPQAQCRCSVEQVQRYSARLSGPLLDRIDMHIEVPRLSESLLTLQKEKVSESSVEVQQRVENARHMQMNRQQIPNAKLSGKLLEKYCRLENREEELLNEVIKKLQLSARAYHRILKVARTIADLSNNEIIRVPHLSEALGYRKLGKLKN